MSRRVVVTGIGLVTPLGIGAEASWEAIRAGKSGIARITQFDPTAFPCQIAGEVKGFDPAQYVEKKEIKKMGRFIQFAIAASDCALANANFNVAPGEEERVGVYIGSGIGGFEVIEREHQVLLEHGPRRISPFFHPRHNHQPGLRARFDPDPGPGPQLGHRHGLHHQRALDRRFVPPDPAR